MKKIFNILLACGFISCLAAEKESHIEESNIIVRAYRHEIHYKQVKPLFAAHKEELGTMTSKALIKRLTCPNSITKVAIKNGKVVGCYILSLDDKIAMLYNLVVKEKRCGIGTQLMNHAINYAKENKSSEIQLCVFDDNEIAINFYQKCGFRRNLEHESKVCLWYKKKINY